MVFVPLDEQTADECLRANGNEIRILYGLVKQRLEFKIQIVAELRDPKRSKKRKRESFARFELGETCQVQQPREGSMKFGEKCQDHFEALLKANPSLQKCDGIEVVLKPIKNADGGRFNESVTVNHDDGPSGSFSFTIWANDLAI